MSFLHACSVLSRSIHSHTAICSPSKLAPTLGGSTTEGSCWCCRTPQINVSALSQIWFHHPVQTRLKNGPYRCLLSSPPQYLERRSNSMSLFITFHMFAFALTGISFCLHHPVQARLENGPYRCLLSCQPWYLEKRSSSVSPYNTAELALI